MNVDIHHPKLKNVHMTNHKTDNGQPWFTSLQIRFEEGIIDLYFSNEKEAIEFVQRLVSAVSQPDEE